MRRLRTVRCTLQDGRKKSGRPRMHQLRGVHCRMPRQGHFVEGLVAVCAPQRNGRRAAVRLTLKRHAAPRAAGHALCGSPPRRAVMQYARHLFFGIQNKYLTYSSFIHTIKYGQTLSAEDYGFPVDSYGLIMVGE